MENISTRALAAATILTLLVGTFGYHILEGWSLFDGFYMTAITMTTVGFGEVHPLSTEGRVFTLVLLFVGVGIAAFALSGITSAIFRGELQQFLGRRKMLSEISKLKDHYIVVGFGRMGQVIAEQLTLKGIDFVVIDNREDKATAPLVDKYLHVEGDALSETSLRAAGIERAKGFISVVSNDADNAFSVMTARGLNPNLYIVSRALSPKSIPKLKLAGAHRVIAPYLLGGTRIAQAVIHPAAADFVERLEDPSMKDIEMADVVVGVASPLSGMRLDSPDFRAAGVLVVGIRNSGGVFNFQPDRATALSSNDHLVVVGPSDRVEKILKMAEPVGR